MNRRSFLAKLGLGAVAIPLAAKNLGSASASDHKEVQAFKDADFKRRWNEGLMRVSEHRQVYINQPYAWGDPVYVTEVRMSITAGGVPDAMLTWSDGYITRHALYARQGYNDVRIWEASPAKGMRVSADEKSVEEFDIPDVMGGMNYSVYAPKTLVSSDGFAYWEIDAGTRFSGEARVLSFEYRAGHYIRFRNEWHNQIRGGHALMYDGVGLVDTWGGGWR